MATAVSYDGINHGFQLGVMNGKIGSVTIGKWNSQLHGM
jgi:hypothetical protein